MPFSPDVKKPWTIYQVEHRACGPAMRWLDTQDSFEDAWNNCTQPFWMDWAIEDFDYQNNEAFVALAAEFGFTAPAEAALWTPREFRVWASDVVFEWMLNYERFEDRIPRRRAVCDAFRKHIHPFVTETESEATQ